MPTGCAGVLLCACFQRNLYLIIQELYLSFKPAQRSDPA